MPKRVKSDRKLVTIDGWKTVDYIVSRIGDLQGDIEAAQAKAQAQIGKIKADLAETVKPAQDGIKNYTESIEAWAVAHRGELGKKQSRRLNHGTVGWRKSSKVDIRSNAKTLALIGEVFGDYAEEYIHVKELPDKEALKRLTDEQLKSVGARRRHKEVFFVEPDNIEAADYG